MKKLILVSLVMIASVGANAQKMKFKVEGLKDTTIFLANYFGPKLYYADTAYSKNGVVEFDGSKHQTGLYAVITPGTRFFEVIIDNKETDVEMHIGNLDDMIGSMTVKKSENNKVFYDYIHFMTDLKKKGAAANKRYSEAKDEKAKEAAQAELKALSKEVAAGQKSRWEANKERFIGVMIRLSMEVDLPEPPRDENGIITDSNFVYNYYVEHFWDDIDFSNPSIVNTPVYHNKLDKYYSQTGVLQIPDTIIKYAGIMLEQMVQNDESNRVFQYTCHHITQKYESSKIMGMDKVFWWMGKNYYCAPNEKAYWMSDENLEKLCERVRKIGNTILGEPSPMLILTDTTETNWINTYKIDAEYTILYFWDPNCGHCKKTTPKLQNLYDKKFKDRNVEIVAVGKATGEDFEAWKKYIRENNLTFINMGLTKSIYNQAMEDPRPLLKHTTIESLNYSDTYDIYSTPRIFVLDKNKILKFKQLSISQLEEIIDNLTGHKDDPKIYTAEDDKEDEEEEDGHEGHNH